jgi:leader peptidase (prepilin peptidase)/N-methyltransferase
MPLAPGTHRVKGWTLIGVPIAFRSARGMQLALPFGVFLGLATLAVLFFGPALSDWYLALTVR